MGMRSSVQSCPVPNALSLSEEYYARRELICESPARSACRVR
jgi:hypothetical protein